jgi:hypothetical protein
VDVKSLPSGLTLLPSEVKLVRPLALRAHLRDSIEKIHMSARERSSGPSKREEHTAGLIGGAAKTAPGVVPPLCKVAHCQPSGILLADSGPRARPRILTEGTRARCWRWRRVQPFFEIPWNLVPSKGHSLGTLGDEEPPPIPPIPPTPSQPPQAKFRIQPGVSSGVSAVPDRRKAVAVANDIRALPASRYLPH